MKPYLHSKASVVKYGGKVEDYQEIHDFIDSSKAAMPDIRHRAILHSAFGIYIVEKVFGTTITNSDNKTLSVRDIAEDHVMQDLGFIPTLENYLKNMQVQLWMSGTELRKPKKIVSYEQNLDD